MKKKIFIIYATIYIYIYIYICYICENKYSSEAKNIIYIYKYIVHTVIFNKALLRII